MPLNDGAISCDPPTEILGEAGGGGGGGGGGDYYLTLLPLYIEAKANALRIAMPEKRFKCPAGSRSLSAAAVCRARHAFGGGVLSQAQSTGSSVPDMVICALVTAHCRVPRRPK